MRVPRPCPSKRARGSGSNSAFSITAASLVRQRMATRFRTGVRILPAARAVARSRRAVLAEALLDGLSRPLQGFGDLRPCGALRSSLLDCGSLNLLQDLLHVRQRVEDHERLVARPDPEHRPAVASQNLLGYALY